MKKQLAGRSNTHSAESVAPTKEDHAGPSYEEDNLYENYYHHMLTPPVPSVDINKHIGYPAPTLGPQQ